MSSANYRLMNRICHSKLFNSTAISRLILTQKQCITTCQKYLFINQNQISNNNLYNNHNSFSFSTKPNDDEDTDSDLSDFSDLSDSDESDTENAEITTQKQKQKPKTSNQWKFGHDDISPDLIMKDRLIISNLNFSTNRNDLWELCENYGTVIDVHLPANKNRDFHNRGFGFVTFENDKDAQNALDNVAGIMYNSRQLRAGFARKDTEKPSVHNPTSQKLKDRSDFQFTSRNAVDTIRDDKSTNVKVNVSPQLETLSETAITINGLPGNVNLAQITKMFNEFGTITNISFSPYRMFGHSFMNAIVSVNLQENKNIQENNNTKKEEILSFQEQEIKDRSVDKSEMPTIRRNMNKKNVNENVNSNKASGIDPDVLAKEIDELLADSDEEGDDNDSDSDSESESDSDSSSDDEEVEGEEKDESSSDSDDDDRIK